MANGVQVTCESVKIVQCIGRSQINAEVYDVSSEIINQSRYLPRSQINTEVYVSSEIISQSIYQI